MYIAIAVILVLACWAWNKEHKSRRHTDWMLKNDPDFRDEPGNKYFRG